MIGVDVAFLTYIKTRKKRELKLPGLVRYTPEQIFFLNAAQMFCAKLSKEDALAVRNAKHTYHTVRLIGTLWNSKKFAKAFSCRPGDPMNPIQKCNLWKMSDY